MPETWNNKVIAYNLKFFRQELRLTQTALIRRSKLSLRAYTALERGRGNPTVSTLLALSSALQVSPYRFLQLNSIRLKTDFNVFLEFFKTTFENFPGKICIRTTSGLLIWGNKEKLKILPKNIQLPVDLHHFYRAKPEVLELARLQFNLEQKGISQPYVIPSPGGSEHRETYYRLFPTLVYPMTGKTCGWTCIFSEEISDHSEALYFKYCSLLLESELI